MPLISVIIPLFNQRQYVGQAIDSVLAQTHGDLEIIVVDDGSTDSPEEVLSRYKGITVLKQTNSGVSAARNAGWKAARGGYLQFLDADDWLHPDKLRHQVNHLVGSGADISYCAVILKTSQGRFLEVGLAEPLQDIFFSAYVTWGGFHATPAAYVFRRSALEEAGGFQEGLAIVEDRLLLMKCAYAGTRFGHVPFIGAMYRKHSAGVTADLRKVFAAYCELYRSAKGCFSEEYVSSRYGLTHAELRTACLSYYYYQSLISPMVSGEELAGIERYCEDNSIVMDDKNLPAGFFDHLWLGRKLGMRRSAPFYRVIKGLTKGVRNQ